MEDLGVQGYLRRKYVLPITPLPLNQVRQRGGGLITDLQRTLFIRLAVRCDFVLLQAFGMLHMSTSDSCSLCSAGIQVVDVKVI